MAGADGTGAGRAERRAGHDGAERRRAEAAGRARVARWRCAHNRRLRRRRAAAVMPTQRVVVRRRRPRRRTDAARRRRQRRQTLLHYFLAS